MKVKNIIVTVVVIIILILPKFLINPINDGTVKKEVAVAASKSGSEWLEKMKSKFIPIEDILEKNNIPFEEKSEETAKWIYSNEVSKPLKDFKFILAFNVGLKDSKYANEKSEIGRINFTLEKGEKFNISEKPLLVDLMNKVCEQKNYDYSFLDKKLNEGSGVEYEVGKYKIKIQVYKNEKDETNFEWTAERAYETVSDEK